MSNAEGLVATKMPNGATVLSTPPKAKQQRRLPLTMGEKFAVMKLIEAGPDDKPDADIADLANKTLGLHRPIDAALVGNYRESMGKAKVPSPTKAEMRARMEELERQLAEARQGKLELGAKE